MVIEEAIEEEVVMERMEMEINSTEIRDQELLDHQRMMRIVSSRLSERSRIIHEEEVEVITIELEEAVPREVAMALLEVTEGIEAEAEEEIEALPLINLQLLKTLVRPRNQQLLLNESHINTLSCFY